MSQHWAYYRVSSKDQSIEAQRDVLTDKGAIKFDVERKDEGVSGLVPAAKRPGLGSILEFIRKGDVLHVFAIDRLGRDAIDVQSTVRDLIDRGVRLNVHGLGEIAPDAFGRLVVGILAQVADMQRAKIEENTANGRETARRHFEATGRTHKGKDSLGRKPSIAHDTLVQAFRMLSETGNVSATAKALGINRTTLIAARDSGAPWAEAARVEAGYAPEQGEAVQ
ncbi:putative DNA-invertase from lambdoid prophage Rac [Paraburkholderia sp. MM5496-R1]|uniref:recombinase family protein n=1 Tax=Paraburkholderia sp. MM5496-R1 TaxID=2991065 RepID=UPI003D1B7345